MATTAVVCLALLSVFVGVKAEHCEWQPVFRILPGVEGTKVRDVWTAGVVKDFGTDPLLFPATHYKSPLVEEWETLGIQLVKVSLYTYRHGTEVRELIFDGRDSDKLNWFSLQRLISSPWTDLATEPTNFFSIPGEVEDPTAPRSFYINRNYGGCPVDRGWLAVVEGGTTCDWETRDRAPQILYSRKSTNVNWNAGGSDVGEADVMVISVKTCGHFRGDVAEGDCDACAEHPLHHHPSIDETVLEA